jgi:acetyl esterase/lipase
MIIEKERLWEDDTHAKYVKYLMDNSQEIQSDRKHPAIVVCGGGGFLKISEREKEPVALHFLNEGFQVFVLDYHTKSTGDGSYPKPVYDLAKMILTIRENAELWKVDPEKIAVIGFSTGGHLCASLATQWQEEYLGIKLGVEAKAIKPNAVVLCYPLLDYLYQQEKAREDQRYNEFSPSIGMRKSDFMQMTLEAGVGVNATLEQYKEASPYYHITENTPPTFIWHTANDELVYVGQSLRFAERLGEHQVPYELHIFEKGAHGLSLANKKSTGNPELINGEVAVWADLALKFLNRHFSEDDRE